MRTLARRDRLLDLSCALFLLVLYVTQFVWIRRFALDVPVGDEWAFTLPGTLAERLNWDWVFSFHNEHRIVFTKILTWVMLRLNHWDIAANILFNYSFYLLVPSLLAFILKKTVPENEAWAKISKTLVLVGAFSPLLFENHLWGFQSQFHFALVFWLGANCFLFLAPESRVSFGFGLACLIGACFSFSNGVPLSLATAAVYVFSRVKAQRKANACITAAIVLVGVGLWFRHYPSGALAPHPKTFPWHPRFWKHFCGLTSLGFGLTLISPLLNVVVFPVTCVGLGLFVKRAFRERSPASASWLILSLTLGVLAALATISLGRAAMGITQSKSSRYFEFAFLLVPCNFMLFMGAFETRPQERKRFQIAFFAILLLALGSSWRYSNYRNWAAPRPHFLTCVYESWRDKAAKVCEPMHWPLDQNVEYSRKNGFSFTLRPPFKD